MPFATGSIGPTRVFATGGLRYWKDGRETCDNVEAIYEYAGGQKMVWSSILYNAHLEFNEQIMGDRGSLIITLGKGMYYRESVAKVSSGKGKENWMAGATVSAAARRPNWTSTSSLR